MSHCVCDECKAPRNSEQAAQAEREAIAEVLGDAGIPHAHDKGEYTLLARVRMLAIDQAEDAKYRAKYLTERDAAQAEAAARLELIGDAALFLRSARRHLEGTRVEDTPWFNGLVHLVLVLEKARREPSALAARVPLWRDLERLVRGGCTPLDERVGDLLFKLAALDAQEPK